MKLHYENVSLRGVLGVLPSQELDFLEDMQQFDVPEKKALRLKTVMGYDKHRVCAPTTTVSDLVIHGFNHLFNEGLLAPEELDGLVLVTQTPDYWVPPTSFVIHGALGLRNECVCLDINQGCAGFIIGLQQAFSLLSQPGMRQVAVVNADVLSRKVSRQDKNSWPLAGDGAAITLVVKDEQADPVEGELLCDGSRHQALLIPAGGFRQPSSPETAELRDVGENNFRALDHLHMDGTAVFNFVMTEVPELVNDLLARTETSREEVDWFLFHQPNRFMLEKLADALEVPREKLPCNVVERFGNANGVTIPSNMVLNLSEVSLQRPHKVCLSGFGVGLTWGAMLMTLPKLDFCTWIEHPEP